MRLFELFASLSIASAKTTTLTTQSPDAWTTEYPYTGSTWSPYKCGNCGCCCKPEHRGWCSHDIYMSSEWECSNGDYLLWEGVDLRIDSSDQAESFNEIDSAAACRGKCDEYAWCSAFQFDSESNTCTVVEYMSVGGEYGESSIMSAMKCDHTPNSSPEENPNSYLWSSCENHKQAAKEILKEADGQITGLFVPQCEKDGSWKTQQCHASTGFCHCVNSYGGIIPGSEVRGKANCEKDPTKKVTRLSNEIVQALAENTKSSAKLASRIEKVAKATIRYYNENKDKCDFGIDEENESERSDQMNPCDIIEKRFKRWGKWIEIYNAPCGDNKNGTFKKRMLSKLEKVKTKSQNVLQC